MVVHDASRCFNVEREDTVAVAMPQRMERNFRPRASRVPAAGNRVAPWDTEPHRKLGMERVMAILYSGIELAKKVFELHGVDEPGKTVLSARA